MKLFLSIVIVLFFALVLDQPETDNCCVNHKINVLRVSTSSTIIQSAFLQFFIDDQDPDFGGVDFYECLMHFLLNPFQSEATEANHFLEVNFQTPVNSFLIDLPPPVSEVLV